MNKIGIWLGIISIPIIIICAVNLVFGKAETSFHKEKCTRYCHTFACLHYQEKVNDGEEIRIAGRTGTEIYAHNVRLLQNNFLGLNYHSINVLVYVLFVPMFLSYLLYKILKKAT